MLLAVFLAFALNSHVLVAAVSAFISWAVTSGWYARAKAQVPATIAAAQAVAAAVPADAALVKEALPHAAPVIAVVTDVIKAAEAKK